MAINLNKVTITGADDNTDIGELIDLSAEFPFVEWGILISERQVDNYRFPSFDWIQRFSSAFLWKGYNVSTHICEKWTRDLLVGDLMWDEMPLCIEVSDRIQINTHSEYHANSEKLIPLLRQIPEKQIIFQFDGVNDYLLTPAKDQGIDVAALFDTSGGAGILPESWPEPHKEFPCGYAGGLGPDNVITQIRMIERLCKQPYWIDMERRVRTDDDSSLDMVKVRRVLKQVQAFLSAEAA